VHDLSALAHLNTFLFGAERSCPLSRRPAARSVIAAPVTCADVAKAGDEHVDATPTSPSASTAATSRLANFVENVLAGSPPPVTIDDGLEALRIALAAKMSWQSGQAVRLAELALA
jgi:predicted dehydrogenase